jgi:hypothetical protein
VDESSIKRILTNLNAFPRFLDVLRSFGQRTGFEDDSAGGIYLRSDEGRFIHGMISPRKIPLCRVLDDLV